MSNGLIYQLGIIGGGVMGEALLSRLVSSQVYDASRIIVSDPQASRCEQLQTQYSVHTTSDNQAVYRQSETLLLAIKPQIFDSVVNAFDRQSLEFSQLVLSILAGTPLQRLEAAFSGQPVIRAMPNTPAIVGVGMTAIAPGQHVEPEHLERARRIFSAVGDVVEVPEYQMDAVTGLSGSGPGYMAVIIEALTDGGVAVGLPRAIAAQLALQTVRGSAELLYQTEMHPAELKDRVTSPGGTTIAGISALESSAVRSAMIQAIRAAYERSKELGKG
ncbi:MAG: pyrroline-5-carboxylate reductase [Leptolyngbyaceae bacterium]|nr:pyrroline-5-carboxylate reductase [Leptolyngbyaceae bacterium]